jgi:hypothetical protein
MIEWETIESVKPFLIIFLAQTLYKQLIFSFKKSIVLKV